MDAPSAKGRFGWTCMVREEGSPSAIDPARDPKSYMPYLMRQMKNGDGEETVVKHFVSVRMMERYFLAPFLV